MFSHPNSTELCSAHHAIFGKDGNDGATGLRSGALNKSVTQSYTVLHSRFLPSFLKKASDAMGVNEHAAIDFPPDLIMKIILPLD